MNGRPGCHTTQARVLPNDTDYVIRRFNIVSQQGSLSNVHLETGTHLHT
jgi:hypothetical protein